MIQLITPRRARPRRTKRVTLVEIDGTPVRPPASDHALSWPAWTDNHFWEPGSSPHDLADHVAIEEFDPDDVGGWAQLMIEGSLSPIATVETDAEFLARVEAEEAAEKYRLATTYFPTLDDLADYDQWLSTLDDTTPEMSPGDYPLSIEDWDAVRRGQVSAAELSQLSAHGCI